MVPSWHAARDVSEGLVPGLRKSSKALPESVSADIAPYVPEPGPGLDIARPARGGKC